MTARLMSALVVLAALGVPAVAEGEGQECFGKSATIVGSADDDIIRGTSERDVIVALEGDDVVRGGGGRDVICGNAGSDRAYGGTEGDKLFAGRGVDLVVGRRGADWLDAGPGRDELLGGLGEDLLDGGVTKEYLGHNEGDGKSDRLNGGGKHDDCFGYEGDRLKSCEGIIVE